MADALEQYLTRISQLQSLLNEANGSLSVAVSNITSDLNNMVSRQGPKLAYMLQKSVKGGKIDQVIIVGGALGAAYVCAMGYDAVRNRMARNKAKQAIASYVKELIAKQGLLIEEQQRIHQQLLGEIDLLEGSHDELQAKYANLKDLISRISSAVSVSL